MFTISEKLREKVYRRDLYSCCHCGKTQEQHKSDTPSSQRLHLHHILPRRYGGRNTKNNLITLCPSCHQQIEYVARRFFKSYESEEAKRRTRWYTVKRVDTHHPLSTHWKVIERRRYHSYVGDGSLSV